MGAHDVRINQKETGQQCKMIFVFDGVRMNTFPPLAPVRCRAVRGGVARPRGAAPSLGAFRLRLRVVARSCA